MQLSFPFFGPGMTDFDDPELQQEFDKVLAELDAKWEPYLERFRESERLTEDDFNLMIY